MKPKIVLILFVSFFSFFQSYILSAQSGSFGLSNSGLSQNQVLSVEGSDIDMTLVQNKINVLKVHILHFTTPAFTNFKYSFKKITEAEYEVQKPSDALPFDVGFVATDGTINVSEPTTTAQKETFKDINQAALYYLCQSYLYFFYQTREMPLLFRVGFPAFEAGLNIPGDTVKTAINSYGGTLASFDLLNNSNTFVSNNGLAVAYAFGEFMNIFKNWGYPVIFSINASGFVVNSSWWSAKSNDNLLADFNRYLNARFLETDENLRISSFESENFRYYTRAKDKAINFPSFSETVETAYKEYTGLFNVKAYEKLTFFTLPECIDAQIEGIECGNRLTSGTAWSSGLHSSCAVTIDQLPYFIYQNRHELGHAFQGLMPQGQVTAWLNEGFASFVGSGPITSELLKTERQNGIDALEAGTKYFGHRPTYEDTKVYPSPDYGYYTMGYFLNDFIYRKGGYQALKDVQMGDLDGYKKMGYPSSQAFLDDFYFDFDVRVQDKPLVALKTPTANASATTSHVDISWTPLKAGVKLNVLVSTDNKASWTEVAHAATQTSCVWEANAYIGKFFLKFVAPDNLNVESTMGPFAVTDPSGLSLGFPNGGEYIIAEDTVKINWENTTIANLKLEYSDNNGANWKQITASCAASALAYKWVVPNISSNQCKVRITDATNASKTDASENVFNILKSNQIGGPYLFDKNTLLLLHFDNDLSNRAYTSGNAIGSVDNIRADAARASNFGNALQTLAPVNVKHTPNLTLTGDWTIEAWIKPTSINANVDNYILTKPGDTNPYEANYSLEINPWWNNTFYGFFFSGAGSRIGKNLQPVTLNEWYHVAFIRDTKNSQIKMVVHDKNWNKIAEEVQAYTTSAVYVNSKDLLIGSGFTGYIDELRISNVVRSFIATGISNWDKSQRLTVSPNPTDGNVWLSWDDLFEGEVNIQVLDISGQVVYSTKSNNGIELNLSFLPKGLYLVRLINKTQMVSKKLILK